jgi:hypothetical protein
MVQERSRCTACVRAAEEKFPFRSRLSLLTKVDTLTVLCSGKEPSDVQIHGTGKFKLQACVRATEVRFSFRPRLTLLPIVDTLTVLFSGRKPSDFQIYGTGNLKLHGL